jgi:hypothetical protein
MTIENRLNVFSDDSDVVTTLLNIVPNTRRVDTPELADITITDTPPDLDYNSVSLKDFWNAGHIFWALPNKCGRFDQETVTTFLKGISTRLDGVVVSPCHEFINNSYFDMFKGIHNTQVFDLVELDGPKETLITSNTLDQLVSSHSELLTNRVASVMYSRDKKYFVRLSGVTELPTYQKIFGFFCVDERSVLEIAANKGMDQKLKNVIYHVFSRFNGAFTIEYYENLGKIYLYSLRAGVTKDHVNESILNIDIVQNTFNRMSVRYNFERTDAE